VSGNPGSEPAPDPKTETETPAEESAPDTVSGGAPEEPDK
jgi:hypothetical protein